MHMRGLQGQGINGPQQLQITLAGHGGADPESMVVMRRYMSHYIHCGWLNPANMSIRVDGVARMGGGGGHHTGGGGVRGQGGYARGGVGRNGSEMQEMGGGWTGRGSRGGHGEPGGDYDDDLDHGEDFWGYSDEDSESSQSEGGWCGHGHHGRGRHGDGRHGGGRHGGMGSGAHDYYDDY